MVPHIITFCVFEGQAHDSPEPQLFVYNLPDLDKVSEGVLALVASSTLRALGRQIGLERAIQETTTLVHRLDRQTIVDSTDLTFGDRNEPYDDPDWDPNHGYPDNEPPPMP